MSSHSNTTPNPRRRSSSLPKTATGNETPTSADAATALLKSLTTPKASSLSSLSSPSNPVPLLVTSSSPSPSPSISNEPHFDDSQPQLDSFPPPTPVLTLQQRLAQAQQRANEAKVAADEHEMELEIQRLEQQANDHRKYITTSQVSYPPTQTLSSTALSAAASASLSTASPIPNPKKHKASVIRESEKCTRCAHVFTSSFCPECGLPSSYVMSTNASGIVSHTHAPIHTNTHTHTYAPTHTPHTHIPTPFLASLTSAASNTPQLISFPMPPTPLAKAEAARAKIIASQGKEFADISLWSREYSRLQSSTMTSSMHIMFHDSSSMSKQPSQPNNFIRHTQLWHTYLAAEFQSHMSDPSQHPRLMALLSYSQEIARLAQLHPYPVIAKYDREHRMNAIMTAKPLTDLFNQGLASLLVEPQIKCNRCFTHGHLEHDCSAPDEHVKQTKAAYQAASSVHVTSNTNFRSSPPPSAKPCNYFNQPAGCNKHQCMFQHICSHCHMSNHGRSRCRQLQSSQRPNNTNHTPFPQRSQPTNNNKNKQRSM